MIKLTNKIIIKDYKVEHVTNGSTDLEDAIYPEWLKDNDFPTQMAINNEKFIWSNRVEPISINDLENFINIAKSKVCNYVEILHHEDHGCLYLYGIDIKRTAERNVDEVMQKIKEKHNLNIELEIQRLQQKIEAMQNNKFTI